MNGNKINKIFIILTPFHYKAFFAIYKNLMHQKDVIIIKESYLDNTLWENTKANIIDLPEEKFRVYDLKSNFFQTISKYRKQVKDIKIKCDQLINDFNWESSISINIGSDRDVFAQVFLNQFYKKFKNINLYAFDEGLGYYDTRKKFDKIKRVVYPILSPLLLGDTINFNKPMGIDKRIDVVYCRFPDLIIKNGYSEYRKLEVRESNSFGKYNPKSTKVLVFSFPNKTIDIADETKISWISSLYKSLPKVEFEIKLHPREELFKDKIKETYPEWKFLSSQHSIEELNYFDYLYIVNFNSSIVIDILFSGYPEDKIITVDFGAKLNLAELYNKTKLISINELTNETEIRF